MTCLTKWGHERKQVLWVTLTTSLTSDCSKMNAHWNALKKRIERKFNYPGIEYAKVYTSEGCGVLHILLAWDNGAKMPYRTFYIPQKFLSTAWQAVHQSSIVWIRRLGAGKQNAKKMGLYIVSQYCASQLLIIRTSWSWKKTLGFPLVACWKFFKHACAYNYHCYLEAWNIFLSGKYIMLFRYLFKMSDIKSGYEQLGADYFKYFRTLLPEMDFSCSYSHHKV